MKKIVLLSFSFASLYAAAQNVKLEVGKTFKTTTTIESVSEMMGQENTTNVTSTSNLKIVSLDKNLYKGNSTLAKMTMTGSMMGQDINFDSDKKADMDSQIGQMLGGAVGKATEFTIDKNTGEQKTIASAEKEESGAMGGLMGGSGSEGNQNIFFVDAISKKVGEKWSKTTDVDGLKTINNYEIITIKEGLITLSSNGTTKGSTTKSFGPQSVDMTIDTKTTSTLIIDANTGLIKSIVSNAESNTSMDMGGQTMATTGKTKITVTTE